MSQYVPIIITALLGMLGLLVKTKKDEKPGSINKLTLFGLIVLFLLIASFVTAIWTQKNKEREIAQQQKDEEIKSIKDSIRETHKFELDSVGHLKTIANLELQKSLTLNKIIEDSFRYKITISKLSQQLENQRKEILDIQRIIHPIKYFTLAFKLEISAGNSARFDEWFKRIEFEFNNSYLGKKKIPEQGFDEWTNAPNGIYTITAQSHLYPTHDEELMLDYVFIGRPTMLFYQTPEGVNDIKLSGQREGKPDLIVDFPREVNLVSRVTFNQELKKCFVEGKLNTTLDECYTNGKITSLPDFKNAFIVIKAMTVDSSLSIIPVHLNLEMNEVNYDLPISQIKIINDKEYLWFVCRLPDLSGLGNAKHIWW